MVTCMGDLHIWTLKNNTCIPDSLVGCHSYHDKNEQVSLAENPYMEERQHYDETGGVTWMPKKKLRDALRESEDLLAQLRVITYHWVSRRLFQVILSNCTIISYIISSHGGDLEKIFIDKSLVGKLSSDVVSDVLLTPNYAVICHAEKTRIDFFYFTKKTTTPDSNVKLEKISALEPKLLQLDLPGTTNQRLHRRLSCSVHQDLVLLWWPTSCDDAKPWSPVTNSADNGNVIILFINGPRVEVLAYTRTEFDPIHVYFSTIQPNQFYTLEKTCSVAGETKAHICLYEIIKNKVNRVSVTTIPLKSSVVCHARNSAETKLVLGCDDGALLLYDSHRNMPLFTKAAIIPEFVTWHPGGAVFFVGNSKGDIQLFDMALTPVYFQLTMDELNPSHVLSIAEFFRTPMSMSHLQWCPVAGDQTNHSNVILLGFERGPLAVLQFKRGITNPGDLSSVDLVKEYVKYRQLDQAVLLLTCMDWDVEGADCYLCLSIIINFLLRVPLNADREEQLQAALGTFYTPKRQISDATIFEYRDPVSRIARRFFHHLLRYARFDKAFLLAVDIGARDLFMDIHYMALDKGQTTLAEVARQKAEQIENGSLDADSFDDFEDDLDDGSLSDHSDYRSERQVTFQGSRENWQLQAAAGGAQGSDNAPAARASGGSNPPTRRANPYHVRRQPDYLQAVEVQLADELIRDYTVALMDDPPNTATGQASSQQQGVDLHPQSVKVIHFGLV